MPSTAADLRPAWTAEEERNWVRLAAAKGIENGAGGVARSEGEAGVIHGFSVITRGEVRYRRGWIDETALKQTVKLGHAAGPTGLKCRFTHPGLSNDGLGKFLGRARKFRRDGDQVRADLYISKSAEKSPEGNLAEYVLDLAERDPEAFATSIVFEHDYGAEEEFRGKHSDADGNFTSPDPDNEYNLEHVRLAALHAVDAVDEPAANPTGFFGRGNAAPAIADQLLEYCLGHREEAPDLGALGLPMPARNVREYLAGFLARHGLQITPIETESPEGGTDQQSNADPLSADAQRPLGKENEMSEEKKALEGAAPNAEALESARQDGRETALAADRQNLEALRKEFPGDPEFVMDCFSKGMTVDQAKVAKFDATRKENEELKAKLAGGTKAAPAQDTDELGEETPPDGAGEKKNWMEEVLAVKAEKGCTFAQARKIVDKRDGGKLHEEFVDNCPVASKARRKGYRRLG